MAKSVTAKLFKNGRSQAVRLPKEFRFEGKEVRVRKYRGGVLIEPMPKEKFDTKAWFAKMDSYGPADDLFPNGREQPPMPPSKIKFD